MATAVHRRIMLWTPAAVLLLAALAWLFRPQPVAVDLGVVELDAMQVSISDEGEARVRDVFTISAPVAGLMRRVQLKAGDHVIANETVIARLEPSVPMFLDQRAEAEARAALEVASASRTYAQAQSARAEAEREFADSELSRLRGLASRQTISQNDLDAAERRAKTAAAAVAEAKASIKMRDSEYRQARARLLNPAQARRASQECDCVLVYSPISGSVLRVIQESEGIVAMGTPIIELGDPRNLEVQVELLSEDAIRVRPGQRAVIEGWGGPGTLDAVVRRVEPFGYTKVSALGIEEQRVRVLIDITEPYERWRRLGHGYRVQPRIITWEAALVMQVPVSALFRRGDQWAVFVENDNRAQLAVVEVGQQNGLQAQIVGGLEPGQRIILHPNDRIEDRVRIALRAG